MGLSKGESKARRRPLRLPPKALPPPLPQIKARGQGSTDKRGHFLPHVTMLSELAPVGLLLEMSALHSRGKTDTRKVFESVYAYSACDTPEVRQRAPAPPAHSLRRPCGREACEQPHSRSNGRNPPSAGRRKKKKSNPLRSSSAGSGRRAPPPHGVSMSRQVAPRRRRAVWLCGPRAVPAPRALFGRLTYPCHRPPQGVAAPSPRHPLRESPPVSCGVRRRAAPKFFARCPPLAATRCPNFSPSVASGARGQT